MQFTIQILSNYCYSFSFSLFLKLKSFLIYNIQRQIHFKSPWQYLGDTFSSQCCSLYLFVYLDFRDRSKFDYGRLRATKSLPRIILFESLLFVGLDSKISSFNVAPAARKTEWTAGESHSRRFLAILVRPHCRFPSKFWLGNDPKCRGTTGSQVTSTFTSPWTRSSAGCYVSSLKNIKARDMLMKSTSITSCWRENQSWNSTEYYIISFLIASHLAFAVSQLFFLHSIVISRFFTAYILLHNVTPNVDDPSCLFYNNRKCSCKWF